MARPEPMPPPDPPLAEIEAMIRMTDYLIQEAAKVSPLTVALLKLARTELVTSAMLAKGEVVRLRRG